MNNEIEIIKGDALELATGVLVHGCNTEGVMGSGIARGVKTRYPNVYDVYKQAQRENGLKLGSCSIGVARDNLYIVNAITQTLTLNTTQFERLYPVSYDAIARCFNIVNTAMNQIDPEFDMNLCFPKIGAVRGGGDWNVIQEIIKSEVSPQRKKILYIIDEEPADCR